MEMKIKHLEMIQNIVNRLSNNSFMIKGWSVVLVSALFALSSGNAEASYAYLAFIPACIFWGLDGYFLCEERRFRVLYDHVRNLDEADIDFAMDPSGMTKDAGDWKDAVLSRTLLPFHGALLASILLVMFLSSQAD